MRRTVLLTLALMALNAPAAFAHDGGEGLYGATDDRVVTYAGFILIAFFPLLIFVLSMIQRSLEKFCLLRILSNTYTVLTVCSGI